MWLQVALVWPLALLWVWLPVPSVVVQLAMAHMPGRMTSRRCEHVPFPGCLQAGKGWLFSVALGRIWRHIIGIEVQEFWVDTLKKIGNMATEWNNKHQYKHHININIPIFERVAIPTFFFLRRCGSGSWQGSRLCGLCEDSSLLGSCQIRQAVSGWWFFSVISPADSADWKIWKWPWKDDERCKTVKP